MEEDVRRKVAENIGLLIDVAQLMHIPIVVTEQYPRGLGQTSSELIPVSYTHLTLPTN